MFFSNIGTVTNPLCNLGTCYGEVTEGLSPFISNVLLLLIAAGGIFALFNIITAGIEFISSQGDPKGIEGAKQKIYMSVIGLVVITASYAIAAIVGLILTQDATFFLTPKLYGPGSI